MTEEVRPLEQAEYDAYFNMGAQAFRASSSRARRNREWTRTEELRGLFEDGTLRAGLKIIDLPIWMGQSTVRNGAITGVASPPENRRRGYIARLLRSCIEELRDNNVPVATLYPFSFPFYKRFGWEHVEDKYTYKVPIDKLPSSNEGGTWEAVSRSTDFTDPQPLSGQDLSVLMDIYNAWCVGKTGPLARDEHFWRRGKLQQGAEKRPDVYVWRGPDGRLRAYVVYEFEELQERWTRRLGVWDYAALDLQAFRALLSFLRNHDSQATEVSITVPAGYPFLAMFDDPAFDVKVEGGFMLRLVDIGSALSARCYDPEASGRLSLTVKDSFCDWNNGTYLLEVEDSKGTAQRITGSEEHGATLPAITLDQKALSQLYTGYLTAEQAESIGLLEANVPGAAKLASHIFKAPRPFMPDGF